MEIARIISKKVEKAISGEPKVIIIYGPRQAGKTTLIRSLQPANFYFWRTYDQQEIDLIEEREGKLTGYECKWSPKKSSKLPKDWITTYKNAGFKIVNRDGCFEYLES